MVASTGPHTLRVSDALPDSRGALGDRYAVPRRTVAPGRGTRRARNSLVSPRRRRAGQSAAERVALGHHGRIGRRLFCLPLLQSSLLAWACARAPSGLAQPDWCALWRSGAVRPAQRLLRRRPARALAAVRGGPAGRGAAGIRRLPPPGPGVAGQPPPRACRNRLLARGFMLGMAPATLARLYAGRAKAGAMPARPPTSEGHP